MPIYEYECAACQNVSEHILRLQDPHPTSCPFCEQESHMRKLISRPSDLSQLTNEKKEDWDHTFRQQPRLKKQRPANAVKDGDGHYKLMDPNDPKLAEIKQQKATKDKRAKEKSRQLRIAQYKRRAQN